jgi:hypothetical protein
MPNDLATLQTQGSRFLGSSSAWVIFDQVRRYPTLRQAFLPLRQSQTTPDMIPNFASLAGWPAKTVTFEGN